MSFEVSFPNQVFCQWSSRRVWVDNKELLPDRSQKIVNHSPDGFNWGYGGSATSQFALALLLELTGDKEFACHYYQSFKWDFVAMLPKSDVAFPIQDVRDWIAVTSQEN